MIEAVVVGFVCGVLGGAAALLVRWFVKGRQ